MRIQGGQHICGFTAPVTLPALSTATPSAAGDDNAESSAWLRLAPGPKSAPTEVTLSGSDAPPRCLRIPLASIQPNGAPSGLTTSAQPSRSCASPTAAGSVMMGMSWIGRLVASKNCSHR